MLKYLHWRDTFPQQLWPVNISRNSLIGTVWLLIPLSNGRNLQYLDQHFSVISILVRLHCTYYFGTITLYVQFIVMCSHSIIVSYVRFILSCTTLEVRIFCALYMYWFTYPTQILRTSNVVQDSINRTYDTIILWLHITINRTYNVIVPK